MRGVMGLLLAALGLGVIYVGYTGHLPGHAADSTTGGTQDPFAGIGNAPPGWKPTPAGGGTSAGSRVGNAVAGIPSGVVAIGNATGGGIAR